MTTTWNEVNNTIAQTANTIITVRDTLTGLGIEVSNVCDAESITDAIDKLITKWWDDVRRSIDNISFDMVGNFLTTLTALLTQLLSAAVGAVTNIFLLEILAGNLINSILSALVFAFSLIPGAELVLQYYLATSLKRDLVRRRELGIILRTETNKLIELFDSFYRLFKFDEDLAYTDLKKALKNIRKAESLLGKEISKNFYGGTPVTLNNVTLADTYIDRAINNLTHQNYDIVYNYIISINRQYNITPAVPNGLDIASWTKYFEDLQPFIVRRFFTYNHTPGTDEYNNEVSNNSASYNAFISAMMKVMPPILQRLVLNATFKDASNVIFERIPVWANNIKLLKDIKSFLDNSLSVSDKFLNSYLNLNNTHKSPEPALFKNNATKDITWRNITAKIRIGEAGVLLFPSYWDYIKNVGGILQSILFPALNILKNVDVEIDNTISSSERPSVAELSIRQFKWIEQLTGARGILSTITNSTELTTMYGTTTLNPIDIYNKTVEAEIALGKLQQYINNKVIDPKTKEPLVQACDSVYETAQKYLGNLVANMYIIINPMAAKNTIIGLQSMKVSLNKQIEQDKKEIALCSNFLNIVESNPIFIAAKPYMDKLLFDLSQTEAGSGIANQLLTGDLSGIISILEGYHLANDVANLINCENQHTGLNVDPTMYGIAESKAAKETKYRSERAISKLKDQQDMILNSIPRLMEMINELV